jgi:hypothetical protein
VAAVFFWTAQPLPAGRKPIRAADWTAPYTYYWIPMHERAAAHQDWTGAAEVLRQSTRYEPAEMTADLAPLYATVHATLAEDLGRAGDQAGAAAERSRAGELIGLH